MKKLIYVLNLLVIFFTNVISQNITYKIGPEYETPERFKEYGYFLTAGNKPANVSFIREQEFGIQPIDLNSLNYKQER